MTRIFTSLLVFLLLFSMGASAQNSPFEKGYLVLGNDTIQGYIKSGSDLDLSKSIQYKSNLNTETTKEYYPGNINGFGFQSNGIYFATVKAEIIKGSNQEVVSRFAKLLLSGYSDLYKLQIPEEEQSSITLSDNTFLYILHKDSTYYTLGLYETQNGNSILKNPRFRGTLIAAFYDCENLNLNFERIRFDDRSIFEAVTNYNTCKDPSLQTVMHRYKAKSVIKQGVDISLAKLYMPHNPNNVSAQGYSAGYFWDIVQPGVSRKYSTKLGVSYTLFNRVTNGQNQEQVTTITHYIRFPFSVQYHFKDPITSGFSPFINAGFTAQVSPEFKRSDLIPLPSIGFGMYVKRFRYAIQLENEGFAAYNPKIINASVGIRLK